MTGEERLNVMKNQVGSKEELSMNKVVKKREPTLNMRG
jgi:hypothetical protein